LTFEHAIEALLDQAATLAYSGGSQCSRSWSFRDKQPSDERTEFLINDRLSFMWFLLGLGLAHRLPDARAIWLLREKPTQAGVLGPSFERFDATLRQGGYIAMSGQNVDASLVAAPRQRCTDGEKRAIKEGRVSDE
jgi:transposase, IS5 family